MKEIILSPNMCRCMDGFALWFIAYTSLSRDSSEAIPFHLAFMWLNKCAIIITQPQTANLIKTNL